MRPFRLTDIPISLTFNPFQSEFASLIVVIPTVQQNKGSGKVQTARSGRVKLLFEVRVTRQDKGIGKALHQVTILKGTKEIA
jgi:hypothetical protein